MMFNFPEELLTLLRTAKSVAVLTGAGLSAESGIPTFRDPLTGHWAKYNPHDLATPEAYSRDPEMVSRWYDERRCSVGRCAPNAGHVALAALEQQCGARGAVLTIITQNVDRLHQAARSRNVIEMHGTLWVWRCMECGIESEERGTAFEIYPPRCYCGGIKRPGVVWFGEPIPPNVLLAARRAAESAELMLSLGTSSVVQPAAGLMDVALNNGGKLLEINPERTPYSDRATWYIRGSTGQILPELVAAIRPAA